MAHLTNFSFEFFYKIFTEDASLPLLYHGAKKSKMTKNSNHGGGGPALSRPTFGDVASAASHDIGARNAIEIFRSRPTFGDVASAASHDIGARNAIEIF